MLDGGAHPDTVLIPWQGWSLSSADFVLTRTMEVLVHSDDLAASIGVETPRFPDEAADAVLGLLASVAAARHGQARRAAGAQPPAARAGSVSAPFCCQPVGFEGSRARSSVAWSVGRSVGCAGPGSG